METEIRDGGKRVVVFGSGGRAISVEQSYKFPGALALTAGQSKGKAFGLLRGTEIQYFGGVREKMFAEGQVAACGGAAAIAEAVRGHFAAQVGIGPATAAVSPYKTAEAAWEDENEGEWARLKEMGR